MKSTKGKKPISLISGVVSAAQHGRRRAEDEEKIRAHAYRSSLNSAFLKARTRVRVGEMAAFFANARKITNFSDNRFSREAPGYAFLRSFQDVPAKSLKFELRWLSCRFADASKDLCEFIDGRDLVEMLVLRSEYEAALAALSDLESSIGASLWSTSLRIALLQQIGGDQAQKEFLAELRRSNKGAVLPFFARYASQRAEKAVPIGWYLENGRRRLGPSANEDSGKYLYYRVTGELPVKPSDLAAVLRIEQNHHIVDMYETYVSVLQELSIKSKDVAIGKVISECLSRMDLIHDFRLAKLEAVGGGTSRSLRPCNHLAMDSLLLGDPVGAVRKLARDSRTEVSSLYSTAVKVLIQSIGTRRGREGLARNERLDSSIATALVSSTLVSRKYGVGQSEELSRKFGHVFEGLPYANAVRNLSKAIGASDMESHFRAMKLATLNAREFSIFDAIANSDNRYIRSKMAASLPVGVSRKLSEIFSESGTEFDISLPHEAYGAACASHNAGDFDSVESIISSAMSSSSSVVTALSSVLALSAYGANGSLREAAELISHEVAKRGRAPQSLPIASVFKDQQWRDIAPYAGVISMSNALAAYAETETDDELLTIRNFALRKTLQTFGVLKPSELPIDCHDRKELIYFLANACVADVLDMLPSLPSSRSVKEERRDICAQLVKIDEERAEDHKYDVQALTKEIAVSQGLQTIDASRVHVDLPPLRAILRKDLSDSFHRYLSLINEQQDSAESFDSILREYFRSGNSVKHLLAMPESDSDDLLISMIMRTRDRFLFNVPHGLDSYLSKRVRHGSIVGFLRSPAEAEGMITQQYADGRYKENSRWGRHVAQSSEPLELQRAFLAFSRSLDQHLLRLKDVLLHVKSDEKPLGLFDISLIGLQYRIIRSVTAKDRTLDGFIDTLFATFKGLMNPSLGAASSQLSKDTSKYIGELFDGLRAAIKNYVAPGNDRNELISAVNRSSVAVQSAVASVASWFTPLPMEDYKFDMDMVSEISLASVKSIVSDFNPRMNLVDETGLTVDVKQLPFLQDILFIIIGNVAKWSGMSDPAIDMEVTFREEKSLLKVRSVSDVDLRRPIWDARRNLIELKEKLKAPGFMEAARREGSSGIPKLASIAFQSEYGGIDFGIGDDNRFYIEAEFSIQVEKGG
ncbi:TPA: hypothetical protein UM793_004139 [Stenotrophomonas maltophilia]|nr:hypothetical protein [Stenotrophomonas maltophilia]HEL4242187.1 hypothetical protein [Stenotrophomonas maltophilia]